MANTSATGGFIAPSSPPPPEDDDLDALLQETVAGITGIPGWLVRPRWQPRPPPQPDVGVDWAAVGIVEEEPEYNIYEDHQGDADNGRGQTVTYDNDYITALVSFYGPRARGYAKVLRTGMMISQNREVLFHAGIGLAEIPGKLTFLPDLVNTQTQRRVDISMRLVRQTALVWPVLNLVSLRGEIITDDAPAITPLITPHSMLPLKE